MQVLSLSFGITRFPGMTAEPDFTQSAKRVCGEFPLGNVSSAGRGLPVLCAVSQFAREIVRLSGDLTKLGRRYWPFWRTNACRKRN